MQNICFVVITWYIRYKLNGYNKIFSFLRLTSQNKIVYNAKPQEKSSVLIMYKMEKPWKQRLLLLSILMDNQLNSKYVFSAISASKRRNEKGLAVKGLGLLKMSSIIKKAKVLSNYISKL